MTGKYRGSAHGDSNIEVKLNHKVPVGFHKLKNYNSHLILQELGNFNLKISFTPNGLGKYSINNELVCIDIFPFLGSS